MADGFKYVQNQFSTLAGSGCTLGATSITLTTFTQIDGTLLTMADFGTIGFGTLEPGNGVSEEQICWTGIVQNANGTATLTGVSHVLFVSPYTQTSGTTSSHPGGAKFIISNTAGFYNALTAKNDDETVTGTWTFTNPNYPRMDTATPAPTDNEQFATKKYVDDTAVAGAPNATTGVKGIVQLPTQTQVDAKTAVGSTGANLTLTPDKQRSTLLSDYVVDTGAANAYVITPSPAISAYTTGQIFTFKATHTNTTTSTINVNALGVKTIKKLDGATNLAAGDIVNGQIIQVEYDGTNFLMVNPVANAPATIVQLAGIAKFGGNGSDGTLTITSGTTTLSCSSLGYLEKNYTSISITGSGNLAFSNPNSITGATIALKSQGAITITTSSTHAIDVRGLGGEFGTARNILNTPSGAELGAGGYGGSSTGGFGLSGVGGQTTHFLSVEGVAFPPLSPFPRYPIPGGYGSPGFTGGANGFSPGGGGAGGAGGGGLYLECGGAYIFTTGALDASGTAGSSQAQNVSGGEQGGSGGGGAGGNILVLANSIVSNTGAYTVTGGAGGGSAFGGNAGGAGGAGSSLVMTNIFFY